MNADKPDPAKPSRPRPLPTLGYSFMVVFMFGVSGAKMLASGNNQLFWMFHTRIFLEYLFYQGLAALLLAGLYLGASRVASDRSWRVIRSVCIGWIVASAVSIGIYKLSNRLIGPRSLTNAIPWLDALVLGAGIPFALLPRFTDFVARMARLAAKLFSPLPLVLVIFFAAGPQYTIVDQPPPPAPVAPAVPAPVLLIIMDSLDQARTTEDPEMMRRFPNLAELAAHGTEFKNPRTPGLSTHLTMPAILYQDRDVVTVEPNRYARVHDGETVPISQLPSWFELVGREGDFRALIGFHLSYHDMIGDRVQWLRSPADRYAPMSEGLLANLRSHAYILATPTRVPLLSDSAYAREFHDDRWAMLAESLHASALTAVRDYGPSLLAVFHMVLPHMPWLFDAGGRRPTPELPLDELYAQNLEYGDKQLGELLAELRRLGLWDASTIIVTGDHGFPWAVAGRQPPLLIKLPGQTERVVVQDEMWTCDIASWLHQQPEFTALRPPRE